MIARQIAAILLKSRGSADSAISDRELLRRFADERDEGAFTLLVWRHSALVWRVCRGIVANEQDAEDVFQATFLVLARKAAASGWHESVANWLYETAYRLARKARAAGRRKTMRLGQLEGKLPAAESADEMTMQEGRAVLYEELAGLPETLRTPLVLCYLEGATQEQAARRLGWSHRTLRRRLDQGKEWLGKRLARRGIGLSVLLLTGGLTRSTLAAGMPAALPSATIQAALAFAVSGSAGAGVSAQAAALANGALRTVFFVKGSLLAVMLATVVAVAGGGLGFLVAKAAETRTDEKETESAPPSKAIETRTGRVDRYGDPLPPGALARMGTTRLRHGNGVHHVFFAPDGKTVASGGTDDSVRLWDVATGKLVRSLKHPPGVQAPRPVFFAPDGKTLISTNYTGDRLWLWDVRTSRQIRELKLKLAPNQGISSLTVSSDGKMAASREGEAIIQLWDLATGNPLRALHENETRIAPLSFSRDNQMLAAAADDGKVVQLWNVPRGKLLHKLEHPRQQILTVAFSPDGKTLATAGIEKRPAGEAERNANTVRLWDVATGKLLRTLEGHQRFILALSFSPDGKILAWGGADRIIRLWDITADKELRQLKGHLQSVQSLSFSPDGKMLASGGSGPVMHLWDVATGEERVYPKGIHTGLVRSAFFSSDGRTLATVAEWGEGEDMVRYWDAAAGKPLGKLEHLEGAYSVVFAPDGKTLALGGANVVRIWDATTGKLRRQLKGLGNPLAFSPDSKLLAAWGGSGATTVGLWDVAAGTQLHALEHPILPLSAAFSPDSKRLAVGTSGSILHLWDAVTGKELRKVELDPSKRSTGQVTALSFSPDGKTLAVGSSWDNKVHNQIHLLDISTGKELYTLTGHSGQVRALAFSPRGQLLASGGYEQAVRLWEVQAGLAAPCHEFHGHDDWVPAVAFSPDGRRLASSSWDSTALVWDVTGQAEGPTRAARLTPGELTACWQSLANTDAVLAYRARRTLAAAPEQAVPFLAERLRQQMRNKPDSQQVARLLAELDSDDFPVRSRATKELAKLGETVEPALRQALKDNPSPEVRRRIQQLLSAMHPNGVSPCLLSWLRVVEVLEWIDKPAARELLKKLAADSPREEVGRQAQAALERLRALRNKGVVSQ